MYTVFLWAAVCKYTSSTSVYMDPTCACKFYYVIFLCKSVGCFFCLLHLSPSLCLCHSLSPIGGRSSLAQPDTGIHCLLAGNSLLAKRGSWGRAQVLVKTPCPSVSSPIQPLGESDSTSYLSPSQKLLGETPGLWALLSGPQQSMSQAIVYHFNLCTEVMGARLVPSPDGSLVATYFASWLLVPWPVTSRPTASLTSASHKSMGKVNPPHSKVMRGVKKHHRPCSLLLERVWAVAL